MGSQLPMLFGKYLMKEDTSEKRLATTTRPFECGSFFDPLKQFSKVAFYLVLLSISSKWFCLYGQIPEICLRQVIEETQKLIGEGNFAGASPYLDELLIRFEDDKNPEVEKILQQFGFVRGIGYLQSFAKRATRITWLEQRSLFGFCGAIPNDSKAVRQCKRT